MLSIVVRNQRQNQQLVHADGPLEFGRGPQREEVRRILVEDIAVSRDQLSVQELPAGRIRIKNLSYKKEVTLEGAATLEVQESREIALPVQLKVGDTDIEIALSKEAPPSSLTLMTVLKPVLTATDRRPLTPLRELGDAPAPERFAHWLETLVILQRSPAGTEESYERTAQALVDLIGLDIGMVLMRRDGGWARCGCWPASAETELSVSHGILGQMVAERRTYYDNLDERAASWHSAGHAGSVVASPIFAVGDEVAGALYGWRRLRAEAGAGVRALEAQVVQLLAAAVGANIARTVATRIRVQFEQFFSAELAAELERNRGLLESRNQEVSILVSDLRGFTSLSERLDPETTCALVRDMMEQMSQRIMERGGVIVDYAGDGILAMWNAPRPQEDHAARACRAALAMLEEMPGLNARWRSRIGVPLALGIGINTGRAQVGNTGSSRKFKYGPHDYTVNLASRVQNATKELGFPLLITAATHDQLKGAFSIRKAPPIALPGVAEQIDLYEVDGEARAADRG